MKEIIYNGDLNELSSIRLKDKDTGEELEFIRVNRNDLIESLKDDAEYITIRGLQLSLIADRIEMELEEKGCFNPVVSLEDLEKLDKAMRQYEEVLEEIIRRYEDGELREQEDV